MFMSSTLSCPLRTFHPIRPSGFRYFHAPGSDFLSRNLSQRALSPSTVQFGYFLHDLSKGDGTAECGRVHHHLYLGEGVTRSVRERVLRLRTSSLPARRLPSWALLRVSRRDRDGKDSGLVTEKGPKTVPGVMWGKNEPN